MFGCFGHEPQEDYVTADPNEGVIQKRVSVGVTAEVRGTVSVGFPKNKRRVSRGRPTSLLAAERSFGLWTMPDGSAADTPEAPLRR